MDFALMLSSIPDLLRGCLLTFELVGLSMLFGMILAVPLALMRVSRQLWFFAPSYGYIFFFRGTPLLVQIFLVYYGLSQFDSVKESMFWPILREPYWCAIIAFTLNTAAYTGEILRGAIQSIPHGQIEAARAVGMSRPLLLRRIIAPQALVLALPGYSNELILLLKGSALASTITLLELTGITRKIIAETYKPFELFLVAACIYVLITVVLARIFSFIEHRYTAYRRPPEEMEIRQKVVEKT
ncbi:MAG: ABC transporter permease [Thermodesulfobacteriota bacterium]